MHQIIEGDPKQDSDYRDLLRKTARQIKLHSYFFPSVGLGIQMNAATGMRLAKDLERIADDNDQRDSA